MEIWIGWSVALGYLVTWALLTGVILGSSLSEEDRHNPDWIIPVGLLMLLWPLTFTVWATSKIVAYVVNPGPVICSKCRRPKSEW